MLRKRFSGSTTRTAAQLVQDSIAANEIESVFGNPGTTGTTFLAALARSDAKYVLALNEPSAVGIAAGHSIVTGKIAMVSLHTYPGLASGMFNLRNAYLAGVPGLIRSDRDLHRPRAVARTAARCSSDNGLTASRRVTPDARWARGINQSSTMSGRRFAVSRRIQPIAVRMKNSVSSSIWSAYRPKRSKSPPPLRSGISSARIAERRIQNSSSVAQRSSTAVASADRSTIGPGTAWRNA